MKDRDKTAAEASRQAFLRAGLAAGAAAIGGPVLAAGNPENQPRKIPEWTRVLGDVVGCAPTATHRSTRPT
jgi:hypothetical protein